MYLLFAYINPSLKFIWANYYYMYNPCIFLSEPGLGSKKFPIHLLVVHGTIRIRNGPQIERDVIKEWFQDVGQVEGVVWHCQNGSMFKVRNTYVKLYKIYSAGN